MKAKTKHKLGLWFLFIVILFMGLSGTRYIYKMGQSSKAILKDNYVSIGFAKAMIKALDVMKDQDSVKSKEAIQLFKKNLNLEASNITEVGEKEIVEQLSKDFELYLKNPSSTTLADSMRTRIYKISELNMLALEHKNIAAQKTADAAIMHISLLLALGILTCFSLIFNLANIT
ncbi:hypothetical protein [Solitalea lacus]|uniref:hypothetical protein n=1 Tax=Solitalea lacus TaxID=2911172 RepID=UPI001EDBA019|nr:hypothetical protein [Solitalea lacus]UKJ07754.1 hypothetical protein L2B55_00985 [Solitalea lacus]